MGHVELPPQRLVVQRGFVELGVLDREGRLASHAHQDVEPVLLEPVPRIQRHELDRAHCLAIPIQKRRADHRVDGIIDDALGHVEAGVDGRVGREDRLFGGHYAAEDRAADAGVLAVGRVAVLDGLRHQPVRLRILQDDESAIGLRKDRKQAIQELGQDLGHPQRAAEILADFDQGLEFRRRVQVEPQARG